MNLAMLLQSLAGGPSSPPPPMRMPDDGSGFGQTAQVPSPASPSSVQTQLLTQAPAPTATSDPYQFKGRFGIKGTARDILGTIGDALLLQAGRQPIYAPQRQQEREAMALQDFTKNPSDAIQALSRVNPKMAVELQAAMASQKNAELASQRMFRDSTEKYNNIVIDRALGMLRTAKPDNYSAVSKTVKNYLQAKGVEAPFELPDTYDADAINSALMFGVAPKTQYTEEKKDERLVTTEGGKNARAAARNKTTLQAAGISQAGQNERTLLREDRQDRRLTITEAGKDRRTEKKGGALAAILGGGNTQNGGGTASKGGGKYGPPGTVLYQNGNRFVVDSNGKPVYSPK